MGSVGVLDGDDTVGRLSLMRSSYVRSTVVPSSRATTYSGGGLSSDTAFGVDVFAGDELADVVTAFEVEDGGEDTKAGDVGSGMFWIVPLIVALLWVMSTRVPGGNGSGTGSVL